MVDRLKWTGIFLVYDSNIFDNNLNYIQCYYFTARYCQNKLKPAAFCTGTFQLPLLASPPTTPKNSITVQGLSQSILYKAPSHVSLKSQSFLQSTVPFSRKEQHLLCIPNFLISKFKIQDTLSFYLIGNSLETIYIWE